MDDNRIIIDNANFNRNMPKWATDDTLKRVERMIGGANKQSQKSLKDVLSTLRAISNKDTELFKETQKSNKELSKELRKITKVIASKSSTTNKTTTDNKDVNSRLDKTNATIEKGIKSASSNNQKLIDAILDGNDDVSQHLSKANTANDKVSNQLLKIYDEIRKITMGKSGGNGDSTSDDRITKNSENREGQETNSLLSDIKTLITRQTQLQTRLIDKTVSGDDFGRMMNNNTRRVTEEIQDAQRSTGTGQMGGLSDMLSSAINRADSTKGGGANKLISGAVGKLTNVVTDMSRLLKTTAIGKLLSAGMLAYSAATKAFEYTYDVQTEFRDMIDKGFNFTQLSGDVGADRLDGISMRRTITRNEIGLETATQILEKNTRLINQMGFSTMFGELGNIIGSVDDPNSVTNRLGMTRDQVAIIATDFYAMHRRINSITKDFTSIDRQNLAGQFIENVRRMSQQLGVGIPQVREAIESFTKTERFSRTAAFLAPDESQNIAMLSGMLSNLDIPDQLSEAILQASTSVAGMSDPQVMEAIGSSPLMLELFSQFSSDFLELRNMDVDSQATFLRDFSNTAIQILDRDGGRTVESLSIDRTQSQAIGILSALRGVQDQLNRPPSELLMSDEQVSPIARASRELENMGILISARTEDLFASAADSREGRDAIMNMLSMDMFMKEAQLSLIDITRDVVTGVFDGPIPTILRQIKNVFQKVADAMGWLSGKRHNDEVGGSDADKILNRLETHVLGSEGFNALFDSSEVDGKTVYNIKEGISSDELSTFFSDMYSNSDTREERELIAGSIRSLSRGLSGRDSELSGEAQSAFASIEEQFLGMASRQVSGNERDHLVDVFSGFEDSVSLFGGLIDSNLYNETNSLLGISVDNLRESLRVQEGVTFNNDAMVERLNQSRQYNLQQKQLMDRQELIARRQSRGTIDSGVLDTINRMHSNLDSQNEDTRTALGETLNTIKNGIEGNEVKLDPDVINAIDTLYNSIDDVDINLSPNDVDSINRFHDSLDTNLTLDQDTLNGINRFHDSLDTNLTLDQDTLNSINSLHGNLDDVQVDKDFKDSIETLKGNIDDMELSINSDVLNAISKLYSNIDDLDVNDEFKDSISKLHSNIDRSDSRRNTTAINQSDINVGMLPNIDEALSNSYNRMMDMENETINRIIDANREQPSVRDNNTEQAEYQDNPNTTLNDIGSTRRVQVSAMDVSRPDRYRDDLDAKQLVTDLERKQENDAYSEQVRNSGANSFNQFTQNMREDVTINNQQDDTTIADHLERIESGQNRMVDSLDKNTKALERYLKTKV